MNTKSIISIIYYICIVLLIDVITIEVKVNALEVDVFNYTFPRIDEEVYPICANVTWKGSKSFKTSLYIILLYY